MPVYALQFESFQLAVRGCQEELALPYVDGNNLVVLVTDMVMCTVGS